MMMNLLRGTNTPWLETKRMREPQASNLTHLEIPKDGNTMHRRHIEDGKKEFNKNANGKDHKIQMSLVP